MVMLSLGSNIAPERNLSQAVAMMRAWGEVVSVSQVYETAPLGFTEQSSFLNAAVLMRTDLAFEELRWDCIPKVELSLNRMRDPDNKNGPRTIDIDILFFGDEVLSVDGTEIPDPDLLQRDFLAITAAELRPDFVHPTDGRTLAEIAADVPGTDPAMKPRPEVRLGS